MLRASRKRFLKFMTKNVENTEDTIAAIATPVGEGGIAVIRVSGADSFPIVQKIFESAKKTELAQAESHTIHFGKIMEGGKVVDQVLVSLFKNPHSYTGEDTVELSCHGGLVVSRKILELLYACGAKPAQPGEFTKRAFLNGKIDLTQAEAVLDLIRAKSDRSREIAVRQLAGALSIRFKDLRDQIMSVYANMEAYLDFPDEDLEIDIREGMQNQLVEIEKNMQGLVNGFSKNSLIREGAFIVLAGKPNAGKSSLFNALLERDRAIVSDIPNTTRDVIEEPLEIGGFWLRLADTAGIVSTPEHPLDEMSMQRSREAIEKSHLVLFVVDGSMPLDQADLTVLSKIPAHKPKLILINKTDLPSGLSKENLKQLGETLSISTKTGMGLDRLENELAAFLEKNTSDCGEQITKLRHQNALNQATEALARARLAYDQKLSFEFVTLDLKMAIDALEELIGSIYSEDLLDVIFSQFCIGK